MSETSNAPNDGIEITLEERAAIDRHLKLAQDSTYYEVLGVAPGADRKAIRDAYFALSKRFHPDVYFKRETGVYRERIDAIFRSFTEAYDVLGNAKQRVQYDQQLRDHGVRIPVPQSPPIKLTPPNLTPAIGVPSALGATAQTSREMGAAASKAQGSTAASVAATQPMPPSARLTPPGGIARPWYPEGMVVPPSIRGVVEASGQLISQPRLSAVPGAPAAVDLATRQRGLEAMARRLGGAGRATASNSNFASATSSSPPPAAAQAAEDRAAKVKALTTRADEAQKANDLPGALEALKAALQLQKDDPSIKARIDAISQVSRMTQVADHIEQAKQAARDRQYEKAATHWEKAWEGRREDPTLLLNAAEILTRSKENKRAAELAQRALSIDPKLTKAHVILAMVFTEAGLKASARSAIENLARLEPAHAQLKELREKLGPMSIAEQFGLRGSR